ncbi:hypothetical protein ABPG72_012957 [Tetrahymena utriculariae]
MSLENDNLLEKTKIIMENLLKAQGIQYEQPQSISSISNSPLISADQTFISRFSRIDNQDIMSMEEEDDKQNQNSNTDLAIFQKYNYGSKQCSFTPMFWELQNCANQFFIYGGFCVDFTFKIEEDNALKKLNRQINHMKYYKKDGILILHYGNIRPTIKDLGPLIKRAQSINDPQYYMLSLALKEYQKEIPTFIKEGRQKAITLQVNQLQEQYDLNYQKFEQWAVQEVRKIDPNRFFAFSIHKFNFQTLEFEIQLSGQSKALMALRGIDLDDPYQFTRKEIFHYLDGESNLNLLINQLSRVTQGKEILPSINRMITFDRLKIEINHRCIQFTNRDEDYPYKDEQLKESKFKYEFMIGVAFYDISQETLAQLIKMRSSRSFVENSAFEDFTYSMESQIFLEKYYKDQLEKVKEQPFKKCGFFSQENS